MVCAWYDKAVYLLTGFGAGCLCMGGLLWYTEIKRLERELAYEVKRHARLKLKSGEWDFNTLTRKNPKDSGGNP